jgi:PAS domain-containing protein
MFLLNQDGVLVYFNDAAEQIIGKPFAESARSTRWSSGDLRLSQIDGTPISRGLSPTGIAFLQRRPSHQVLLATGLDGVRRTVQATAYPLFGAGDELHGVVTVFWEGAPDDEASDADRGLGLSAAPWPRPARHRPLHPLTPHSRDDERIIALHHRPCGRPAAVRRGLREDHRTVHPGEQGLCDAVILQADVRHPALRIAQIERAQQGGPHGQHARWHEAFPGLVRQERDPCIIRRGEEHAAQEDRPGAHLRVERGPGRGQEQGIHRAGFEPGAQHLGQPSAVR